MTDLNAIIESAKIKDASLEYHIDIIMVTPEIAKHLLQFNKKNRTKKKNTIDFYVKEMLEGRWVFNGEPVQFNTEGEMVNGQHRLEAQIIAEKTYPVAIVRNIPVESYKTIDQQHTRSIADIFEMDNIKGATLKSAILSKYLLWSKKDGCTDVKTSLRKNQIPKDEALREYQNNPQFYDQIHDKCIKYYTQSKLFTTSEYGAFMCFLIGYKHHEKEKVYSFFEQFVGLEAKSAIVITRLREYLYRTKYKQNRPLTMAEKYGNVALTWNAYLQGKDKIPQFPFLFQKGKEIPKFL